MRMEVRRQHQNIYIRFHCRLGNQLFQFASAYGLARRFRRNLIRVHSPTHFNPFIDEIFSRFPKIESNDPILEDRASLLRIYDDDEAENNCFLFNTCILDAIEHCEKDVYLCGYLQNEEYFREYRKEILDIMQNNTIYERLVRLFGEVNLQLSYFIHIRRGDYTSDLKYKNDDDAKYFAAAIRYVLDFEGRALGQDVHFFVVSDDIEFCKTYSPCVECLDNKTFVEGLSAVDTLYLMSLCERGGICSNSTFSWWGGWLNVNQEKLVIFPQTWMNMDRRVDIQFDGSIML